ncbi:hypothetical protein M3Y98_00096200 [Aphelenchoides besseyi]|nr:hypothetical protein M3Y98_00096200 [Aphelenchoides besseyi]
MLTRLLLLIFVYVQLGLFILDEKNLFNTPYFDHFEHLAIGSYLDIDARLSNFGDFKNKTDVFNYMNSLKAVGINVYNKNYTSIPGDQITVVVFVSDFEKNEIKNARFYAKKLQDQKVRLVLVGHGNFKHHWLTMDQLIRITNGQSTAFKWDDGRSLPGDEYQSWFKQVLGCPFA